MLDLREQITRVVDEAVAPVTADEARARGHRRSHRAPAFAGVIAVLVLIAVPVWLYVDRTPAREIQVGSTSTTTTTAPPAGVVLGTLLLPEDNARTVTVYQGSDRATQLRGPMHDPATPLPGHGGVTVFSGYRTTHGAPFLGINKLYGNGRRGAVITFTGLGHRYAYVVDGEFTVPGDGTTVPPAVLQRIRGLPESLVLVTDAPRYSSAERLVITAHRDRGLESLMQHPL